MLKPLEEFMIVESGVWTTLPFDLQYRVVIDSDSVFLYFQRSSSKHDWNKNLSFIAQAYKDSPVPWKAHGGFLSVWKAGRDTIAKEVLEAFGRTTSRKLYIVGYSHGAAIGLLAHEYFNYRCNIENQDASKKIEIESALFGCPRVLFAPPKQVASRFTTAYRYRVRGDIVTHLPPAFFGFRHVGADRPLGPLSLRLIYGHTPEAYLRYLPD